MPSSGDGRQTPAFHGPPPSGQCALLTCVSLAPPAGSDAHASAEARSPGERPAQPDAQQAASADVPTLHPWTQAAEPGARPVLVPCPWQHSQLCRHSRALPPELTAAKGVASPPSPAGTPRNVQVRSWSAPQMLAACTRRLRQRTPSRSTGLPARPRWSSPGPASSTAPALRTGPGCRADVRPACVPLAGPSPGGCKLFAAARMVTPGSQVVRHDCRTPCQAAAQASLCPPAPAASAMRRAVPRVDGPVARPCACTAAQGPVSLQPPPACIRHQPA